MTPLKKLQPIALSLVAGTLLCTAGAPPASAAFIALCTGYSSCSSQNMSNYGYASSANNMYWRMATGHNCTNYVAYRLVKNGMPNIRPWAGTGMAYNWGLANAKLTDHTPTVGAVAWWAAYAPPIGASGHVAYVEKVVSSTEIIISEDNWGGTFHWRKVTKASYWPSGFIHFKDVKAPAPPAASSAGSPTGKIDRAWTPTAGKVSVTGWAFDADDKSRKLPLSVSVGGAAGARGAERHDLGVANWVNPEVAAAYPGVGDHHGMYATFTTKKRGSQQVYLYASNATGTPGRQKLLGVKTVQVANPDPRGSVALASSPKTHRLRLKGWALDPNAKTKPSQVRAYIGGPAGHGHRVNLGVASLRTPDAAKAVPGAGLKHGYDKTITTRWTGRRTVYVYAVNLSGTPGANRLIGTRTVTIKR